MGCVIRLIGHLLCQCALVGIDHAPTSRLGTARLVECIHCDAIAPIAKKNSSPHIDMRRTLVNINVDKGLVVLWATTCSADDGPDALPSYLRFTNCRKNVCGGVVMISGGDPGGR